MNSGRRRKDLKIMFLSEPLVEMDLRRFVDMELSTGFCIPRAKNTKQNKLLTYYISIAPYTVSEI